MHILLHKTYFTWNRVIHVLCYPWLLFLDIEQGRHFRLTSIILFSETKVIINRMTTRYKKNFIKPGFFFCFGCKHKQTNLH